MLDDFINDGIREFIRDTECSIDNRSYVVTAGNNQINYEYPALGATDIYSTDDLVIDGGDAEEDFADPDPARADYSQLQKINRVLWLPGGELSESRVLSPMEEAGLDRVSFSNVDLQSGPPRYYIFVGGSMKLYPTPEIDGVIRLSGVIYPDTLSADADEPQLPEKYHSAIVTYCLWQAGIMDNDWERTQTLKQNWIEAKAEAVSEQENPNAYSYASVKDVDVAYGDAY